MSKAQAEYLLKTLSMLLPDDDEGIVRGQARALASSPVSRLARQDYSHFILLARSRFDNINENSSEDAQGHVVQVECCGQTDVLILVSSPCR